VSEDAKHVVNQSRHAQLELGCELQPQQVIAELVGHQVQELDLVGHRDAHLRILQVFGGQAHPLQQRSHRDAARAGVCVRQPRGQPHGTRRF
jgi:hypothetical protein